MALLSKTARRALFSFFGVTVFFVLFLFSIIQLDDRFSKYLRSSVQSGINGYVAGLSKGTAENRLTIVDKSILHVGALAGIAASYFSYPEASSLLFHYIYGNGEQLELSSSYFRKSKYLKRVIQGYGNGLYGPLSLRQGDDWRLSLAFNPYFLNISDDMVVIYHPKIEFVRSSDESVFTIVPIGKLKLNIYDNIVSALNPTPFYVYAEWKSDSS